MISPISVSDSPVSSLGLSREERLAASKEVALADATLVGRFVGGDEAAFVEIMTRHREKIFSVSFALLRNRADAEEITQDTFIRAHRGLKNFRGDSSLYTWLHRIVVNLSRNRYWYFFRRYRHTTLSIDHKFGEDSDSTFADLMASDEQVPAHKAAINEFSQLVDTCVEKLSRQHREIFTMRNVLGLSYEQISDLLCIEVGTVKSRIARARRNLRLLMSEMCPELADYDEIIRLLQADKGQRATLVRAR